MKILMTVPPPYGSRWENPTIPGEIPVRYGDRVVVGHTTGVLHVSADGGLVIEIELDDDESLIAEIVTASGSRTLSVREGDPDG